MKLLTSALSMMLSGVSAAPCCGPCGDCCPDDEEEAEECER